VCLITYCSFLIFCILHVFFKRSSADRIDPCLFDSCPRPPLSYPYFHHSCTLVYVFCAISPFAFSRDDSPGFVLHLVMFAQHPRSLRAGRTMEFNSAGNLLARYGLRVYSSTYLQPQDTFLHTLLSWYFYFMSKSLGVPPSLLSRTRTRCFIYCGKTGIISLGSIPIHSVYWIRVGSGPCVVNFVCIVEFECRARYMHDQSKRVKYMEVRRWPVGEFCFRSLCFRAIERQHLAERRLGCTPRSHQSSREKGMDFIRSALDSRYDLALSK
jgi:hypothetical protein